MKYLVLVIQLLLLLPFIPEAQPAVNSPSEDWKSYWYAGKAEVCSYRLQQTRYGETRDGHAVLIFVTEDFSPSKQVKLDRLPEQGSDALSVLKCNSTRQFNTGIYQYNMMMSVFTPVHLHQGEGVLKLTSSAQEWCGQTWMQLNSRENHYDVTSFSYFESEGDQAFRIDKVLLEDELWNMIRLNPKFLPSGKIKAVPGSFYLRFRHIDQPMQTAVAHANEENGKVFYTISYPDLGRKLIIEFDAQFPYPIMGWTETYPAGSNTSEMVKTNATLIKSLHTAYWKTNKNSDEYLRTELGVD